MNNIQDLPMERLLEEIQTNVRETAYLTGRSVLDKRVLEAFRGVSRHAFVPDGLGASAYDNHPLPIGHGQTISQPFIVALMTDLIRPRPEHVVLEVGTGSGYQAAVLSGLVHRVYSVEIILETSVGRARVCGFRVVWQGATTRRGGPRKEEQHRQAA